MARMRRAQAKGHDDTSVHCSSSVNFSSVLDLNNNSQENLMHIFQHGPCRFWTFVVATPEVVVGIQWVLNVCVLLCRIPLKTCLFFIQVCVGHSKGTLFYLACMPTVNSNIKNLIAYVGAWALLQIVNPNANFVYSDRKFYLFFLFEHTITDLLHHFLNLATCVTLVLTFGT